MRWVLEAEVFASGFDLGPAALRVGHEVSGWSDHWLSDWPAFPGEVVVFHGSLGVADRVRREGPWSPGSFCDAEALCFAAWIERARPWLLNADARRTTVRALVEDPPEGRFFVRPDSALKPFSGRVLAGPGLTLAALDHGFYYDDPELPVWVAPVREVAREWRFVVVDGQIAAGSGYIAAGRAAAGHDPGGEAWTFAQRVARALPPPEPVYVLDVCASGGALRVVELNPFSGADLYGCDPGAVVAAVAAWCA